ncbi:putative beta-amylase [Helianthus annuus]|nr:putative beta-amylase [Helianthus annuus]
MVSIYHLLATTKLSVALPSKTVNAECEFDENFVPDNTLEKLKQTGADGVSVNLLWGVVEISSKKYKWSGYKKLFEALKNYFLKIQVYLCLHYVLFSYRIKYKFACVTKKSDLAQVMLCFHEVVDGDFIVSLPYLILVREIQIYSSKMNKKIQSSMPFMGIDDKKCFKR